MSLIYIKEFKIKHFLLILLSMLLFMGCNSLNSEQEAYQIELESIVGSWELVKLAVEENGIHEEQDLETAERMSSCAFKFDSTFNLVEIQGKPYASEGNLSLSGDVITFGSVVVIG